VITDICGNVRYSRLQPDDNFHHRASGYDDNVWIWHKDDAVLINVPSGEIIKQFSLVDLIAANEGSPVLEPRLLVANVEGKFGLWKYGDLSENPEFPLETISLYDPFHQNDVDALSPSVASRFPDFAVGDLLLSFRSINLIVVVDQDSLKIKWYSYGEFSRQHDPDWGYNGEIIVYDNKSHSTDSRIISIDVATKQPRVLVDGEPFAFYQYAGGDQHMHTDGRVFFSNGTEALQVDAENRLVFYLQNQNEKGKAAFLTTTHYLTEAEFNDWTKDCGS